MQAWNMYFLSCTLKNEYRKRTVAIILGDISTISYRSAFECMNTLALYTESQVSQSVGFSNTKPKFPRWIKHELQLVVENSLLTLRKLFKNIFYFEVEIFTQEKMLANSDVL